MKRIIQISREENLKRIARKVKKHRRDEYLPSGEEVKMVKEVKEQLLELLHLQSPQYHWEYSFGGYFRDISNNKPTELTIYDIGKKIKLTILVEYRRLIAVRTESEEIALMDREERRRNQEGWGVIRCGYWRNKRRKMEEEQNRREIEARLRKEKEAERRYEEFMGFPECQRPKKTGRKSEEERRAEKLQMEQESWAQRQRESEYLLYMGFACQEECGEGY